MGRHLLHVLQQNTRKQKRHTKSAQYSLCKMMSNKGRAMIQESSILKFSFIELYIKKSIIIGIVTRARAPSVLIFATNIPSS